MSSRYTSILFVLLVLVCAWVPSSTAQDRPRARDLGVEVGVFPTGQHNAITDVSGVMVGHTTIVRGDSINTGVTAILPHDGNMFREPVPAAMYVANGFGKLIGTAQVSELGVIETPILLTCTLCVWRAADALVAYMTSLPGMDNVRSINPVVGETNDGFLNDIRSRPITSEDVVGAITNAAGGPVAEGAVGAGAGTVAFGWKGGIGTSSRVVPSRSGDHLVGVLVQSNFGGILSIGGAPVGREMGQYAFREMTGSASADGSIMMVVATDAPVDSRQLGRLARRAVLGLGRTGGAMTNGSGDFVIAFSTARSARSEPGGGQTILTDGELSPLFQAVAEATEEAIYNSLFKATDVVGHRGRISALDVDSTVAILRKYGVIR